MSAPLQQQERLATRHTQLLYRRDVMSLLFRLRYGCRSIKRRIARREQTLSTGGVSDISGAIFARLSSNRSGKLLFSFEHLVRAKAGMGCSAVVPFVWTVAG